VVHIKTSFEFVDDIIQLSQLETALVVIIWPSLPCERKSEALGPVWKPVQGPVYGQTTELTKAASGAPYIWTATEHNAVKLLIL